MSANPSFQQNRNAGHPVGGVRTLGREEKEKMDEKTERSSRNSKPWLRKYRGALRLIVTLVVGALVGYLLAGWSSQWLPELDPPGLALLIPAFLFGIFLVLAVHEAGHLLGGWLVGFRFTLFVVGPLKISREGGRLKVGLNRNLLLAGGIAGSIPRDDRNLRRRMAMMTAGGPLASLVLALAAALLTLISLPDPPGEVASVLLFLSFTSFIIALVTLFPGRTGGFQTDGARLLMLLRGGPRADRWCAVAVLGAAAMSDQRPRDWSPDLVRQATAVTDGSLDDVGATMMAYQRALDLGVSEEAKGFLDRALAARDSYPAPYRSSITLEAAYFEARHQGDAPAARAWLEESGNPGWPIEPQTRLRAEAAVLLAEGEPEEAKERAAEGLEKVGDSTVPGIARAEKDWLQEISSLAEESSSRKGGA